MKEVSNINNSQSVVSSKDSKNFIDDAIFEKLLAIREEIYQKTDVNISPRKLVNMLLSNADFDALRDTLIKKYV